MRQRTHIHSSVQDCPPKGRRWPLIAVAILCYAMFLRMCYCLLKEGSVFLYDNWKDELFYHAANIIPMAVMAASCFAIVFFVTDRGILARKFMLKSFVDLLSTAALTFIGYSVLVMFYRIFMPINVDFGGILVTWIVTFLVVELVYYMYRSRRELKKAEYAKLRAVQYQFNAFRSKVNPHFLFNSLNMLMEIIETDKRKAVEFTQSLSDIYRYTLDIYGKSSVSLSDEISFLRSYLHVLSLKYNDFLKVNISENTSLKGKSIVPFTMQLLLENVTKHNVISDRHPVSVDININDDCITMTNGIKRKESRTDLSGLGLKYIYSQYEIKGKSFMVKDDGKIFTAIVPYL